MTWDYLADAFIGAKWPATLPSNPAYKQTHGTAPAPTLSAVSPDTGAETDSVELTGTSLADAFLVTFNGLAATITGQTATTIDVDVPAGTGIADIRVVTPTGIAILEGEFTYAGGAPVFTSIVPAIGDQRGSPYNRTITGSGFTGATDVTIGGVSFVGFFTVDSDSQITVTGSPGIAAGTYSVEVTTPAGTNTPNTAYEVWDLGVDGPAAHYTRPDFEIDPGGGTPFASWPARDGTNLTEATFMPVDAGGYPDFQSGADLLGNAVQLSTWAGSGNHHFVAIVEIDSIVSTAHASLVYNNESIFHDTSGFIGFHLHVSGGNYYLDYYEWDSAERKARIDLGVSIPAGKLIFQAQKTGGQLWAKIGASAWVAGDMCGTTGGTSGLLQLGLNADIKLHAFATYTSAKDATFVSKAIAYAAAEYP